uniref:39S ribosomal protein L52, mitochondrial n=1 Tax=Oryctolagus cuniculus TaxID=9986 RepID=G1TVJ4_RABIT
MRFARRLVLLSQKMEAGLWAWQLQQEEERKQKSALKSKGASLHSLLSSQ